MGQGPSGDTEPPLPLCSLAGSRARSHAQWAEADGGRLLPEEAPFGTAPKPGQGLHRYKRCPPAPCAPQLLGQSHPGPPAKSKAGGASSSGAMELPLPPWLCPPSTPTAPHPTAPRVLCQEPRTTAAQLPTWAAPDGSAPAPCPSPSQGACPTAPGTSWQPAAPGDPQASPAAPLVPGYCTRQGWHPAPGPHGPACSPQGPSQDKDTKWLQREHRRAVTLKDMQMGTPPLWSDTVAPDLPPCPWLDPLGAHSTVGAAKTCL